MASDGTVKIDTDLDSSGVKSGLGKLGSSFSSLASGSLNLAKKGFTVLTGAIAGVAGAMGAGAAAGVKYNNTMEQYTTSFEVMTGSAEKAKEVTKELQQLGTATPFEMTDLAETTQLLMNYGFTADDAIGRMKMLGDISQGSADKMNRIATAYGQMSSAGKVQLEDVKQMIEAGFNPLQEISKRTGESMSSLYDRISKGTLTVDEITASMQHATSEGGQYFQSMEKQSKTFNGQLSTLKDNANQLLGTLTEGIQQELAQNLLPKAIESINQLSDAYANGGTEGLLNAGAKIVSDLLLGVAQALPNIITQATNVINQFINTIETNGPQFAQSGMSIITSLINGILSIAGNLAGLAYDILTFLLQGIIDNGPAVMSSGYDTMANFMNGITEKLPELAPLALQAILTFTQGILDNLPKNIDAGIKMLNALVDGIMQALPMLINKVPEILDQLINKIDENLPKIFESGTKIIEKLVDGVSEAIPRLVDKMPGMINDVVAMIGRNLPYVIEAGLDIIGALLAGIIRAAPSLALYALTLPFTVISAFADVDWGEIGMSILRGIGEGMKKAASALVETAKKTVGGVVDGVKNFFGIHSPSRLMRDEIGKFLPAGIGVGFEDAMPALTSDVLDSMGSMASSMKAEASNIGTTIGSGSSVVTNAVNNSSSEDNSAIYNFDGFMKGAVFNVRSDDDIDAIATALYNKIAANSRGKGVVTV